MPKVAKSRTRTTKKRTKGAYARFTAHMWDKHRSEWKGMRFKDVAPIISEAWHNLGEEGKAQWKQQDSQEEWVAERKEEW